MNNKPFSVSLAPQTKDLYSYYDDINLDIPEGAYYYADGHKIDIDCGAHFTGTTVLLNLDTFEEKVFTMTDRENI